MGTFLMFMGQDRVGDGEEVNIRKSIHLCYGQLVTYMYVLSFVIYFLQ